MVGSAPKVIHMSLGEMKISAEFIETALAHLQTLLSPEAPVVMTFKRHIPKLAMTLNNLLDS